jgi:hypothetical protein
MESEGQPEPSAPPLPKRRWFQYSISTLLLLMVVCAVVLALIVNPALKQRRAVAFVESLGGSVEYSDEDNFALRHSPDWLHQTLGRDYFASVVHVDLTNTQISDAGLAHLKGLTALEWLSLRHTQVSNAGLAHLKGLTVLETCDLGNTQISDAGLAHLRGLTALKGLALRNTQISDAGLAHLRGSTAMFALFLDNTQISDAGLSHLKDLTALEWVDLQGTQVSDAGVAELQKALPNCHIAPGPWKAAGLD